MRKLHCYADESGQDTFAQPDRRRIFVVGCVITDQDRNELNDTCERYERISGKGKFKWNSAERQRRMNYIRLVLQDDRFRCALHFTVFRHISKNDFDSSSVRGIASATVLRTPSQPFVVQVYVDGLSKKKRPEYRRMLKNLGIPVGEVRGIPREQSSAMTRLADALAGLVRDAVLDGNVDEVALLNRAIDGGIITGEWL